MTNTAVSEDGLLHGPTSNVPHPESGELYTALWYANDSGAATGEVIKYFYERQFTRTHNENGIDLMHDGAFADLKVSKENPIILICDGCKTHNTAQVLTFAKESGIIQLCLPPHTSHVRRSQFSKV